MGFLNIEGVERLWTHIVARIEEKVNSVNGKKGDVVLTAEDVGALPNTTEIPDVDGLATTVYVDEQLSTKADTDHNHDSAYDSKGASNEALNSAKAYTDEQIAAIPVPDVSGQISVHNIDGEAHSDIRTLIDDMESSIPDTLSDLSDDSTHRTVTDEEKATWNAKSNFSGNYNDLSNKPNIPSIEGLATVVYVDEKVSTKADSNHNHDNIYDIKGAAADALAAAQTYADAAASTVKNDLLNGAGEAYDTLKELGDLISENVDAIDALETVAAGKADAEHGHDDTYYKQSEVDAFVDQLNTLVVESNNVYVGPDMPTDPNIKVWINTSEEGTGVIPVLPRVATVTLTAANWIGSAAPYNQVVEIATVTPVTKIELNPTVQQILSLQNDEIALMAENDGGIVTVYSFGGKPSVDMAVQVTLTEVSYV